VGRLGHIAGSGRRWIYLASIAGAFFAASYALVLTDESVVDPYVEEDGVVETVGAAALFAASCFFAFAAIRSRKRKQRLSKQLALALLAVAFFVGAGEEISWGQRLLGVEPPADVREANRQGELNIHNLRLVEDWISIERLFQAFWAVYGILIPLACAISERARHRIEAVIPVLPVWVAVALVLNQALGEATTLLLDSDPDLYSGAVPVEQARFEVTETNVALVLMAGAIAVFKAIPRPVSVTERRPASDPTGVSA